MAQVSVKLFAVVATAVALSLVGAGYAYDYSGVTQSSSNDYDVKYVMVVVNENGSGALTETFDFGTPSYYTDTLIGSHTVTYRVPDFEATDTATVRIAGVNTTSVEMYVSLEEALPSLTVEGPSYATVTLQFWVYDEEQHGNVEHGSPIVLSTTPTSVKSKVSPQVAEEFLVNTTYHCEATLEFSTFTPTSPPSSFTVKVVFTASADTEVEP